MTCNRLINLSLSIALLMATALATQIRKPASGVAQPALGNIISFQACLSDGEVSTALRTLSHGSYEDQQKSVADLKADAGRSTICRKQVIASLMTAMDQPNTDLTGGTPQFFLWHYGTQLLGDLKATEALDLLIANFELHDGSGFPFNHYPALGAVIRMGEIALPKLRTALRDNTKVFTRRLTVFCIALIGGQSAQQVLREALESERDSCVASCIRATLRAFNNKRRPYYVSDELRTAWYTTFLCNGD